MYQNEVQQVQLKPASQDGSMDSPVILGLFILAAIYFGIYHVRLWLKRVWHCYECQAVLKGKEVFCDKCQDEIEKKFFS
jgi:hypothetical protein